MDDLHDPATDVELATARYLDALFGLGAGVPRAKILAAVARLSMWVGGLHAVEATLHVQRALADYDARGVASMDTWFPAEKPPVSMTELALLAGELGPRGILVNGVGFSLIDTDGARRAVGPDAAATTRAHLKKKAPTRRPVEAAQVSRAVAWLASPMCQNVTGEVLMVDGGFSRVYLQ